MNKRTPGTAFEMSANVFLLVKNNYFKQGGCQIASK